MAERIYLASPHMGGGEQAYLQEAFDTNWIAPLGKHVDELERQVAAYVGAGYGAALSSGTAALHLAVKAAGVGPGDVVFCPSLTFAASCNPIQYEGAVPVFLDSDPDSYNLSPEALELALKRWQPKAVIVVDLYGQAADMEPILALCAGRGIPVIEDAAEALGSTYRGKKCGSFGQLRALSFNGNKIITTSGGGMLLCDDEETAKTARFWATQSRDPAPWYQHSQLGYNYRLSNICAAIGRGQMEVLEERIRQKQAIYERYEAGFAGIDGVRMMRRMPYGEPNCWLSVLELGGRIAPGQVIETLAAENIEARYVWKPMHLQPYYQGCEFVTARREGSAAEELFAKGVCLPSDTKMTPQQQERVIRLIRGLF